MSQCTDISVQTDNKASQSLSLLASPSFLSVYSFTHSFFFSIPLYLPHSLFPSCPVFPWALCTCYPTPVFSPLPHIHSLAILSLLALSTNFFIPTLIEFLLPHFTGSCLVLTASRLFQNQNQKSFSIPQMGKFVCPSSNRILQE